MRRRGGQSAAETKVSTPSWVVYSFPLIFFFSLPLFLPKLVKALLLIPKIPVLVFFSSYIFVFTAAAGAWRVGASSAGSRESALVDATLLLRESSHGHSPALIVSAGSSHAEFSMLYQLQKYILPTQLYRNAGSLYISTKTIQQISVKP